jgi:hypothetical protein
MAESPKELSSCCAWVISVLRRAFISGSLSRIWLIKTYKVCQRIVYHKIKHITNLVKGLCKVLSAILVRDIAVSRVVTEKLCLAIACIRHRLFRVDILLTTVHDTNEAEFEGVDATGEDIERICTRIHEIELGEDANRPPALAVDRAR